MAVDTITTNPQSYKAKVSSTDTTADYLISKILAGTGISVTQSNAGGNETLTIASTGGSGTFAAETPAESPDGSRTTFTLANAPVAVVVDQGKVMRSGSGWSYAGTTLTLDVAPNYEIYSLHA